MLKGRALLQNHRLIGHLRHRGAGVFGMMHGLVCNHESLITWVQSVQLHDTCIGAAISICCEEVIV